MIIRAIGYEPIYDDNGKAKSEGGKVYGAIIPDENSRIVGEGTFSAYFPKFNVQSVKLGEKYLVECEVREFKGTVYPVYKSLIKI